MIAKSIPIERNVRKIYTTMSPEDKPDQSDSLKRAFQHWKEAASEWITFYREIEDEPQPLTLDKKMRLRALEQRLSEAAEAYEQALQDTTT